MVRDIQNTLVEPADFDSAESAMGVGLARAAEANNYLGWLEALCLPHLGPSCLELGSGYGDLTDRLADHARGEASDLSPKCLAILQDRFKDRDNVTVRKIDAASFEATQQFDTIVMMNVLEHIRDDGTTLSSLRQALLPGGRLILYVPAFMWLYSSFDRQIGHYRRYRKGPLRELLEARGYRVVDARYVNSVAALGWFIYCRLLRQKSSDQITVSACDRVIIPLVRSIERRFPPPFGLSLLMVGERI